MVVVHSVKLKPLLVVLPWKCKMVSCVMNVLNVSLIVLSVLTLLQIHVLYVNKDITNLLMIVLTLVILDIIPISPHNNVPNVKIIAIDVTVQPNVIIVQTNQSLVVLIVSISVMMAIGSNQTTSKAIGAKNAPTTVSLVIPIPNALNVPITMEQMDFANPAKWAISVSPATSP